MAYTAEFQRFSTCLKLDKNLWYLLQNLNYNHLIQGVVDFFENIVDILKVQKSYLSSIQLEKT